jgi:hypothetical protein
VATFGDLKTYVEQDGWIEEPNLSRNRIRTGDHWRYAKEQPDGRTFRTKVSHSVRDEIGPSLFRHILRDQLHVDETTFWAVVRGRAEPEEPAGAPPTPVPGWLILRLIFTVGMSEEEVRALSVKDALAAWEAYQIRER